MARRDEGSRHGGTQRSVTEEKRGKWPARAQPEGLLIFGAAAALLVGQRSVKDMGFPSPASWVPQNGLWAIAQCSLPPRALQHRQISSNAPIAYL